MIRKFSLFITGLSVACLAVAQPASTDFARQLDEYLKQHYPADEPGIAVLVGRPGHEAWFERGYGLADINTRELITGHTLFNLGSVSKTFVGFGVLMLQQRGKLSINDPISKYFPHFTNHSIADKVQIKHLLSHTSGLPDNRPVERDSIFFLTANDEENFRPIQAADTLHFQPGEQFEYSNPAFNGLALIIEQLAHMKWQQFIAQSIFAPAGMKTSVITDGAFPTNGVSHGYRKVNGQWQEYDFGEYPTFCASGNGGVWSSVRELFQYELAIQNAVFTSKENVRLARSPFIPANWKGTKAPVVGFDWFTESYRKEVKLVGHSGDQGGFRAEYWWLPRQEVLIVLLDNNESDLAPVKAKILDMLAANNFFAL